MAPNTPSGSDLQAELADLFKRGPGAFAAAVKDDYEGPRPFDALQTVVDRLSLRDWRTNPKAALESTLEAGIRAIPEASLFAEKYSEMSSREAAFRLYNLTASQHGFTKLALDHVEGHRDSYLLKQLRDVAELEHVSNSTLGRSTSRLRSLMASSLLRLTKNLRDADDPSIPPVGKTASQKPLCPAMYQLPADVTAFLGRTVELGQLDQLLAEASHHAGGPAIAALFGPPGVGKTGLLLHWAHAVRDQFEAELYVDLRGYSPTASLSARDALGILLRSLGIRALEDSAEERAVQFRDALSNRRVLVALDNARDTEHIRLLLPGSGRNFVIVTSRNDLAALRARYGAQAVKVGLLPSDEALALLRILIGSRVDDDLQSTRDLCQLSGRLPLALRLVAGVANDRPQLSLASLKNELEDESRRLDLLDAGGDPQTDVRAVISWSYGQLDPELARAFCMLSVLPLGTSDENTVAVVLDVNPRQAAILLSRLRRGNLLEETLPGRYNVHDLLRLYGSEQVDQSDVDHRNALGRLRAYYADNAKRAIPHLYPFPVSILPKPPSPAVDAPFLDHKESVLTWVELEHSNIVKVMDISNLDDPAVDAVLLLLDRYMVSTTIFEAELRFQMPSAWWLRPQGRDLLADSLLRMLSNISQWGGGEASEGRRQLQHAMDLLQSAAFAGEFQGAGESIPSFNVIYVAEERLAEANIVVERAMATSRQLADEVGEAHGQLLLGSLCTLARRFEEAESNLCAASTTLGAVDDLDNEAEALVNLAFCRFQLGDESDAEALLNRALSIYRRRCNREGEGRALVELSYLCSIRERYRESLSHALEAIEAARDAQAAWLEIEAHSSAAMSCMLLGDSTTEEHHWGLADSLFMAGKDASVVHG